MPSIRLAGCVAPDGLVSLVTRPSTGRWYYILIIPRAPALPPIGFSGYRERAEATRRFIESFTANIRAAYMRAASDFSSSGNHSFTTQARADVAEVSDLCWEKAMLRPLAIAIMAIALSNLLPETAAFAQPPCYSYSFSANFVRSVQRELNARKLAKLKVDGIWGQQTRKALRKFQSSRGLSPTGQLDEATFDVLFSQATLCIIE